MHAAELPVACENCRTVLQGAYCHACGQHAANPLRHFGHAVEEVFESVWHLDGRVFRTLRDLCVPGRVAANYLAGHRARYLAPLRLFLILTVLAFFIGRIAVDVEEGPSLQVGVAADAAIESARSVDEVDRLERERLAPLRDARARLAAGSFDATMLEQAERSLREQAAARRAELAGRAPPADAGTGDAVFVALLNDRGRDLLAQPDRPWDARTNPFDLARTPAFVDAWLNTRLANLQRNTELAREDEALWAKNVLGALPTALFVLVPVFALLLRLVYLRSGRGVLEHLVVALYSHAYLATTLLAVFALLILASAVGMDALKAVIRTLNVALLTWVPAYLLLMQKRVYGDRWPRTVLRYALLAALYLPAVIAAVFVAMMIGLSSGG